MTSQWIPKELQDFFLAPFLAQYTPMPLTRGKRKKLIAFTSYLNAFLSNHDAEDTQLADIAENFQDGKISVETVFRAFCYKDQKADAPGPGWGYGSKYTRDLLSLCATKSLWDWNELIRNSFTKYLSLLDPGHDDPAPDRDDLLAPRELSKADQILAKLGELEDRLAPSPAEEDLLSQQIQDANETQKVVQKSLLQVIRDRLLGDPRLRPVFPPHPFEPKFPASKTYRIDVPGFENVWLKDESSNPTGTHKDRMAYEIASQIARQELNTGNIYSYSIISSGGAAIAIRFFFDLMKVKGRLKVLVDKDLDKRIKRAIQNAGCDLYEHDLSQEELDSARIKDITGADADLTYREVTDIDGIRYYDWLSFEILNTAPEYCFVPFGTGDLFSNLIRLLKNVYINRYVDPDPRLDQSINFEGLTRCHFIGATTHNPNSKLEKLFSYHLPSLKDQIGYLEKQKKSRLIGSRSGIFDVSEAYVNRAIKLARKLGVRSEPSGLAGLALLMQQRNDINPNAKILIVNTGLTNYTPKIPR